MTDTDDLPDLPDFLHIPQARRAEGWRNYKPSPAATIYTTINARDVAAQAEIKQQQAIDKKTKAERAATKREITEETLSAELAGQRRKLPLQGRAALAAIRPTKRKRRPTSSVA